MPRKYTAATLLPAGARTSAGTAINDRGHVAVTADNLAWLYVSGRPTRLGLTYTDENAVGPATQSGVMALNDHDVMLGHIQFTWDPQAMPRDAYVQWTAPTANPHRVWTSWHVAQGRAFLNDSGVGLFSGFDLAGGGPSAQSVPAGALRLPAGADLYTGISERNDVVGYSAYRTPTGAFVQAAGGTRAVLPGLSSSDVPVPSGISHNGAMVVGTSESTSGAQSLPVYWDARHVVHRMTGAPADFVPVAVNNAGAVVGSSSAGVGVWTRGTYVSLALTAAGGLFVCEPRGINDAGQVVASFCSAHLSPVKAVVLTPKA